MEEPEPVRVVDDESHFGPSNTLNMSFIALIANIGTFLFGYEVGATSFLLVSMKSLAEVSSSSSFYDIVVNNAALTGLVVAGASLGAVITYPFLLFYANGVSKKDEILLAAFLFFVGGLLESLSAPMNWSYVYGLIVLCVGRVTFGAGIACSIHAIPQFVSETIPAENRGQFGSATEAMTMCGMILGFGVGWGYSSNGWELTYAVSYLTAILMGCLSVFLPNSPTWLMDNHFQDEEVLHSLRFIYPKANQPAVDVIRKRFNEAVALRKEIEDRLDSNNSSYSEKIFLFKLGISEKTAPELMLLLLDRTLGRSLTVCIFLFLLNIISGQLAVIYYAGDIYDHLYPNNVEECILGFIATKLVVAFLMLFCGELLGRRTYYNVSTCGMAVALLVASFSYALNWTILCMIALYVYAFSFELACGTLTWIVAVELFPHYIRSTANAISVFLMFLSFFIVTFILPEIEDQIGFSYLFVIFGLVNLLAFYFVFNYLPETQGVPIETAFLRVDEKFDQAPTLSDIVCCRCCAAGGCCGPTVVTHATRQQRGHSGVAGSNGRTAGEKHVDDEDEEGFEHEEIDPLLMS